MNVQNTIVVNSNLGGLSFYEDETGKYVVGADSVPKKLGNCNTYSYFNGDIINYSISVLDKNPNGSVAAIRTNREIG